jgi:L-alanine-DL-glutamate epimerase-like enolase superfamily enzyme
VLAVDIIHPDLSFAGGITGIRKIADYAALTRTPFALHNVGSLLLTYADAHFAASTKNFYRSESALGRTPRYIEENMAANHPPQVSNSQVRYPTAPVWASS